MFSPFERMVAWRYLRSKKAEGFVSVIAGFSFAGIMLGVATLIIVMSVMNGFRQELFNSILGINGHMNVYSLQGPLDDYDYLRTLVEPVEGVTAVTPIIESQGLVSKRGRSSGIIVRGIEKQEFVNRDIFKNSVVTGALENFSGNRVAIGTALAEKMKLQPGDELVVTSPQVKSTPFGSMPRQRSYEVAFVFDVGMYQYNNGFIFMPLDAAQVFFQMPGAVSSLEVFLQDESQLNSIRREVTDIVEGRAGVYDWRDSNSSIFNALQVERNVMFLILTLIILVAAFNIISSMIMLVKDKGHDIAIMRTMGATRSNMLRIFMLTGASIGMVGTLFGAVLGISFALNIDSIKRFIEFVSEKICHMLHGAQPSCSVELFSAEIYFFSQLPAEIDWSEVTTVIVIAFTLSVLATIFPALRAARMDPVEALRYE